MAFGAYLTYWLAGIAPARLKPATPTRARHAEHSTITMTLDPYPHVMHTTLRAAADRIDDALGVDNAEDTDTNGVGPEAAA
jgi:hypothetical protein